MPEPWVVAAIAVAGVNLATGAVYAWDKRAARLQRRRVPEATLLGLALLGGWPGAWGTMWLVRHKTQKLSFKLKLIGVTLLWCGALGALAAWRLQG